MNILLMVLMVLTVLLMTMANLILWITVAANAVAANAVAANAMTIVVAAVGKRMDQHILLDFRNRLMVEALWFLRKQHPPIVEMCIREKELLVNQHPS